VSRLATRPELRERVLSAATAQDIAAVIRDVEVS
jgi:hypothetical protein